MKLKCLETVPELDRMIGEANAVTIVIHTHPDGDAVGSGLAMKHYLEECRRKDVVLVAPDRIPDTLAFLTRDERGLLVYDEDPAKAAGRIAASDLLICQDFNAFNRAERAEAALAGSQASKVLIDHHLNPDSGAFRLVFSTPDISSTCELLYWIFKELPDIAGDPRRLPGTSRNALLAGMTTDTNNFANSVFPGTLEMASELLAAGVDRDAILSELYNNYRENRLRLMGYLLQEKMRITPEGAAYMILTREETERFGTGEGETEGFVNLPLSLATVRLSLFLKEDDGHFRVSLRSKRGISANACAMEYFNGGGHEMAAGGKLFFPEDIPSPSEAEAYILKATERFFRQ